MPARTKTSDNFASRLRDLMDRYGVSQSEVATRLEVSQAAVSGWVNGKIPVHRTAKALARSFGVRLDWLLGAGDPNRPEINVAELPIKRDDPPRPTGEPPLIVGLDAVALRAVAAKLEEAAAALGACAKIVKESAGKNRPQKRQTGKREK
jgi:transcriptional regulator with XRE-family HTH domain